MAKTTSRRAAPRRLCWVASAWAALWALLPTPAPAQDFRYDPPGQLYPGSGEGRADDIVYLPGMRFPLEEGPAYANSQVYGRGGFERGEGGQCDAENYSYPWRDDYCERRRFAMPLCPAGTGHQGQDIRPASCEKGKHWAVAAADGTITQIGSYTVRLVDDSGTQYRYLHMEPASLQVKAGQRVSRGARLGQVSNTFFDGDGNRTPTTIHLHFDISQNVNRRNVYIPTYMSLVAAYQALLGLMPEGCPMMGPEGGDVDDRGPCFDLRGRPGAWRQVDGLGQGGGMRWMNAVSAQETGAWARWTLALEEGGRYQVSANAVAPHNTSKRARYRIRHQGAVDEARIDQSAAQAWLDLGTFDFASGGDQWVEILDNTGEAGDDLRVTADVLRLSRVRPPPTPPPTPTAIPAEAASADAASRTPSPGAGTPAQGDIASGDEEIRSSSCEEVPGAASTRTTSTHGLLLLLGAILVGRRR